MDSGFCPRILLCSDFSYITSFVSIFSAQRPIPSTLSHDPSHSAFRRPHSHSGHTSLQAHSHTFTRIPHSAGRIRIPGPLALRAPLRRTLALRIPHSHAAFWPDAPHSGLAGRILTPHTTLHPAFAARIQPPHSAFRPPHSAFRPRIPQPPLAFCSLPSHSAPCPTHLHAALPGSLAGRRPHSQAAFPTGPPMRCAPSPAAAGRIPHSAFRIPDFCGGVKVEPDSGSALVIL